MQHCKECTKQIAGEERKARPLHGLLYFQHQVSLSFLPSVLILLHTISLRLLVWGLTGGRLGMQVSGFSIAFCSSLIQFLLNWTETFNIVPIPLHSGRLSDREKDWTRTIQWSLQSNLSSGQKTCGIKESSGKHLNSKCYCLASRMGML